MAGAVAAGLAGAVEGGGGRNPGAGAGSAAATTWSWTSRTQCGRRPALTDEDPNLAKTEEGEGGYWVQAKGGGGGRGGRTITDEAGQMMWGTAVDMWDGRPSGRRGCKGGRGESA